LLDGLFDPEIRESLRLMPAIVFAEETLPMLRDFGFRTQCPDPEVERQELTVSPRGEVKLTVLRPRGVSGDLPALWACDAPGAPRGASLGASGTR
jgi:hypothetical protein